MVFSLSTMLLHSPNYSNTCVTRRLCTLSLVYLSTRAEICTQVHSLAEEHCVVKLFLPIFRGHKKQKPSKSRHAGSNFANEELEIEESNENNNYFDNTFQVLEVDDHIKMIEQPSNKKASLD